MTGTRYAGFDLDLTLIDSRPQTLAAIAALAGLTGVPISVDQVAARLGLKLEDELGYWFPEDRVPEAAALYREQYLKIADQAVPLPGAVEALAAVRAAGYRVAVVTAKHPVSVTPSLAGAGLAADEVFALRHGPEKGQVLKEIGAELYVGDGPADMTAAVAGGAIPVGVTTGSYPAAVLRDAGADVVLGSLTEFPAWFAALPR